MTAVSPQKYWAIKHALTPAQKDLIKFYELQWMLRNRVPTVDEVVTYLRKKRPSLRETSVKYYLLQPQVKKALKSRGIPFEQHTQEELTGQQQAAAFIVMNPLDDRPINEKLDSIGVLPATYHAWLNDPNFRDLVQTVADRNLSNVDPVAKTEFAKKIQQGEAWALKFYLENTGTLKNSELPASEIIIMKLIEILQKHVQDPAVLGAIANEMVAAFSNRTISSGPPVAETLTGAFEVNSVDEELEFAKKQLGV